MLRSRKLHDVITKGQATTERNYFFFLLMIFIIFFLSILSYEKMKNYEEESLKGLFVRVDDPINVGNIFAVPDPRRRKNILMPSISSQLQP